MSIEFNYTRLQEIKDKTNKAFNNIVKDKIAKDTAIAQAIRDTNIAQAENIKLKTQLQDYKQNTIDSMAMMVDNMERIEKKLDRVEDEVKDIGECLKVDLVTSNCFYKLDSHLMSYSNDTCSLYPECA